jgi:hypothetical protein
MGAFEDVPCPTRIEGAVLGTLLGAIVNAVSVPLGKQTLLRGVSYASIGGLVGYAASKYRCGG